MPSISVPTALAAGIGGAASVGSALIGSSASKSAANTQSQAANQAAQLQSQMFQQTQGNLAPYVQGGVPATNQLSALLGLPSTTAAGAGVGAATGVASGIMPGGGFAGTATTNVNGSPVTVGGTSPANPVSGTEWLNTGGQNPTLEVWDQSSGRYGIPNAAQIPNYLGGQTPSQVALSAEGLTAPGVTAGAPGGGSGQNTMLTTLQNTPGYQFALQQGLQGITDKATATGGVNGGNTLKALTAYGTGLADQTYQQQVQNYLSLAGLGESAAAGQGQLSLGTGSNIANLLTGGAAAQAAGTVGSANAIGSGLNGLSSNFLLASLLQGGSNPYANFGGVPGSQGTGIPDSYVGLV
jgi:hypothetical protein